MAKEFTHSANDSQKSQVQVELLELLLEPDDATYLWNTTDPESEAYFIKQEQSLPLIDWSEEDMAMRLHFFSQLAEIWLAIAPTADTASPDIPRDVPRNE